MAARSVCGDFLVFRADDDLEKQKLEERIRCEEADMAEDRYVKSEE